MASTLESLKDAISAFNTLTQLVREIIQTKDAENAGLKIQVADITKQFNNLVADDVEAQKVADQLKQNIEALTATASAATPANPIPTQLEPEVTSIVEAPTTLH